MPRCCCAGLASTFAIDALEGPLLTVLRGIVGPPVGLSWVPYGTVLEVLKDDPMGKCMCGQVCGPLGGGGGVGVGVACGTLGVEGCTCGHAPWALTC